MPYQQGNLPAETSISRRFHGVHPFDICYTYEDFKWKFSSYLNIRWRGGNRNENGEIIFRRRSETDWKKIGKKIG